MATVVICPDCGGAIGGDPSDPSMRKCKCPPARVSSNGSDTINSSSAMMNTSTATAPETTSTKKTCCICGKDVTGRKRMKDREGKYFCIECGTADSAKKRITRTPCGGCEKHFPISDMYKMGGVYLCNNCRVAKLEHAAKKRNLIGGIGSAFRSHEMGRVKVLLLIAAVLLLIAWWANRH